ncbi:MAG: hypothetical protein R2813_06340 [Flavobacteriales bacterium]
MLLLSLIQSRLVRLLVLFLFLSIASGCNYQKLVVKNIEGTPYRAILQIDDPKYPLVVDFPEYAKRNSTKVELKDKGFLFLLVYMRYKQEFYCKPKGEVYEEVKNTIENELNQIFNSVALPIPDGASLYLTIKDFDVSYNYCVKHHTVYTGIYAPIPYVTWVPWNREKMYDFKASMDIELNVLLGDKVVDSYELSKAIKYEELEKNFRGISFFSFGTAATIQYIQDYHAKLRDELKLWSEEISLEVRGGE